MIKIPTPHSTPQDLAIELLQLLRQELGTFSSNNTPAIWVENSPIPKSNTGEEAIAGGILCLIEPTYSIINREVHFNGQIFLDIDWIVKLISYEPPPRESLYRAKDKLLKHFELIKETPTPFSEGERQQAMYRINEQIFLDSDSE